MASKLFLSLALLLALQARATRGDGICSHNTLEFAVCADVLGGLIHLSVPAASNKQCCTLINGLAELEVGACLCNAMMAGVLGTSIIIPSDLSLLVNDCGSRGPNPFQCPSN